MKMRFRWNRCIRNSISGSTVPSVRFSDQSTVAVCFRLSKSKTAKCVSKESTASGPSKNSEKPWELADGTVDFRPDPNASGRSRFHRGPTTAGIADRSKSVQRANGEGEWLLTSTGDSGSTATRRSWSLACSFPSAQPAACGSLESLKILPPLLGPFLSQFLDQRKGLRVSPQAEIQLRQGQGRFGRDSVVRRFPQPIEDQRLADELIFLSPILNRVSVPPPPQRADAANRTTGSIGLGAAEFGNAPASSRATLWSHWFNSSGEAFAAN